MIPSDKDMAALPPITRGSQGNSSPESEDDGKGAYIPSIGLSGYRGLREQASNASTPPSRRSSMMDSTTSSPTKFPTLDSTRFSVSSTESQQSLKPSSRPTRGSICRSPSCPLMYSDFEDDVISPEVTSVDLNSSIHPHMTRRAGYPTTLKLPEIFKAGAPTQKLISQDNKRHGNWTRANPNASNMLLNLQRREGVGFKRQTSSSVGSSVGSSPTKSDYEYNQFYSGTSNALLLPLRETRHRKKRKHTKKAQNSVSNNNNKANVSFSNTAVQQAKDSIPTQGKWEVRCAEYCSDDSGDSDVSDGILLYDQDVVLDKIAMENKVKFGCMKSICDLDGE